MIMNRGGPLWLQTKGDLPLLFNVYGDTGIFRHARDNSVCTKLIFKLLTYLFGPEGRGMDD